MVKRIVLATTFLVAFGVVGVGAADTAEAWGGGRISYYGPPASDYGYYGYYGGYIPRQTAYRAYHGQRHHGRFFQHRRHHAYARYYYY